MLVKLKIAMRAFRDLLCAAGAVALGAFFAVERSWMWLLPMCLLVAAVAACFYKIEERRAARRDRRMGDLASAKRRAVDAVANLREQPIRRHHRRVYPPVQADVVSALRNLGYSRTDAHRALRQVAIGDPLVGESVDFEDLFQRVQAKLRRPDTRAHKLN